MTSPNELAMAAEIGRLRGLVQEMKDFWTNTDTPKAYFIGDTCDLAPLPPPPELTTALEELIEAAREYPNPKYRTTRLDKALSRLDALMGKK